MEYRGCGSHETTWDVESWFLFKDLYPVLDLDATIGSHPIVVDVNTPDEVFTCKVVCLMNVASKSLVSDQRCFRHDLLQQGRFRSAHARGLPASGRVHGGRHQLPRPLRVPERHHAGSHGRIRCGVVRGAGCHKGKEIRRGRERGERDRKRENRKYRRNRENEQGREIKKKKRQLITHVERQKERFRTKIEREER